MKRRTPLRRTAPVRRLLPLQSRCRACGKKAFATREAAEAALQRIASTSPDSDVPQRAYRCWNGWWHLTRQPARTGPDTATRERVLHRDDYRCACCGRSVLYGPYSLQHRLARGAGGTSDPAINQPSNLVTLCGSATSPGGCHLACEQRDPVMRELGFWVCRGDDPATVPVAHAIHGWVLLLDDGDVRPVEEAP